MNEQDSTFDQPAAWRPTADVIERAQLTRFIHQTGCRDFADLYQKSIENVEWFTEEVLKFLDIRFNPPYEKLLDTSDGIQFPKWCAGGGLNITEMCLDRWQTDEMKDQPAVIWEGEEGNTETLTYSELLRQVKLCAAGLRADGFQKGDAIGIQLPMIPETIIALLAINRIGAIAVPVFSGYGAEAVASRMNAVGAKALITCNDFPRRGKRVYVSNVALDAAGKCPSIEKVYSMFGKHRIYSREERLEQAKKQFAEYQKLSEEDKAERARQKESQRQASEEEFFKHLEIMKVSPDEIERVRREIEEHNKEIEDGKKKGGGFGVGFHVCASTKPYTSPFQISVWNMLLESGKENLEVLSSPEPTDAEDPLIILYTSGTTGKPKGIAHTHCGFPIKAAQDMAFGTDVGQGTRISWVTDIGWMMGPWLIYGALINGATICIYDGAPDFPEADRMWEFCARHKVEILGISPTLVRALANCGDNLPKKHDLSSLRAFASTGEPWNPAPWWWLFEKVGDSRLPIINYSGGTEISGGILMGNPLLPIKPCSFPAPCPGIAADILDENGNSVEAGRVGELAIRAPWIGMARGFWQERERYLETYWSRFENVWVHGDWAMRDAEGHWFILGRSDDTLKVAGKRVGPAEVESLLVGHPLVAEAAVIGVPDELKGTAMIAFCVVHGEATPNLEEELKNLVAEAQGKPLKPNRVLFVSALPKTRNAKVMRRVIRAAYLGEDGGDLSALENPQAVEEIRNAAS